MRANFDRIRFFFKNTFAPKIKLSPFAPLREQHLRLNSYTYGYKSNRLKMNETDHFVSQNAKNLSI
jgi:hypothetical protein